MSSICWFGSLLLLVSLSGCSSPVAPSAPVTVLITNTTCGTGTCTPLEIRGYLPKVTIPGQTLLAGVLPVGFSHSPSTCLKLPKSFNFVVYYPPDSTVFTWTTADSVLLTARDSGGNKSSPLPLGWSPSFIPASAAGWQVNFPDGTGLAAAGACS